MDKRRYLVVLAASLMASPFLFLHRRADANVVAGSIARVSGVASIRTKDGKSREAKQKDPVHVAETIVTDADGQVLIRMNDKSSLLVRPKSTVVIEDFQFDNKADDRSSTSVAAGAIRAVSGQIVIGEGQQDRSGIYNYVYAGSTEMRLDTGETAFVEKELTGFTPAVLQPGEARLQVLRDRPAFLQGSGFDALMQQLTNPRIPMIR
ncbi:MAG: hypothetical protein EBS73_11970 [Betaproteobacteria bacterium]|nr:hypothetical protein [Betaproteobacteria bacterium]